MEAKPALEDCEEVETEPLALRPHSAHVLERLQRSVNAQCHKKATDLIHRNQRTDVMEQRYLWNVLRRVEQGTSAECAAQIFECTQVCMLLKIFE